MTMNDYSKKVKRELIHLRKIASKIAQDRELDLLYREFERWKKKEIGAEILEQAILRHKGFRKEVLEKCYREDGDPGLPVAEALVRGDLSKEDLSAEAYDSIEILINLAGI